MVVEVKTDGKCVTRNGEFRIGAVRAELSKDGMVRLGFVSSRLHRNLHAGTTIGAAAMDELASEWVRRRGLMPKPLPAPLDGVAECLLEANKVLSAAISRLGGKSG